MCVQRDQIESEGMCVGKSLAQYGPHQMIIANHDKKTASCITCLKARTLAFPTTKNRTVLKVFSLNLRSHIIYKFYNAYRYEQT